MRFFTTRMAERNISPIVEEACSSRKRPRTPEPTPEPTDLASIYRELSSLIKAGFANIQEQIDVLQSQQTKFAEELTELRSHPAFRSSDNKCSSSFPIAINTRLPDSNHNANLSGDILPVLPESLSHEGM